MNKERKAEILSTLPSLGWLVMFVLIPVITIFAIAFRPALPAGGIGEGWSLDALKALGDPSYPALFARTIIISGLTTLACLAAGLPAAYAMARLTPAWRSRMLLLVIVPFWTNFVIRVFAWQQILHAEGYVAKFLRSLHIIGENDRLLGNTFAVVLVSFYTYLPFAILPLFAAAEKFDFGLLDAARDLGAKAGKAFFAVFVPGIKQGIITAFLVVFIPNLGSYVVPDMVGGTGTQMIGNKIAQRNFTDRNLPEAAALSGALALLVLAPMFIRRREKTAATA
ncbi:ABC transporter permease [Haloferula sp. BvORR071]|uniref:ABC transporter permease n=1 Tax=Haloferula sp. BvORR071 TaxID=1396141 RepID=UPI000550EF66|nr:ABC transporter permease [Haloferula sp. BvORR071]